MLIDSHEVVSEFFNESVSQGRYASRNLLQNNLCTRPNECNDFQMQIIKTLYLLSLFFIMACSSVQKTAAVNHSVQEGGDEEFPVRVIDSHTHTRFDGKPEITSKIIVTQEQYLKEMLENNVKGAVSHNSTTGDGYYEAPTHHVINCAGVGVHSSYSKIENGLKSKKYRCMKIYLGYVHAYPSDRAYLPAYRLAQKYDVPVVFHTGDTYSIKAKLKYSDPLTIDEVAVEFPKVTFVIAHAGNPWVESAAEVAYKNPNVFIDASAFLIGDLNRYSEQNLRKLMLEPINYIFNFVEDPNKIMFGTDWPLVGMKDYIRVFKRAIPKEHWDKVFYQNARNVFKITELPE